MVFSNPNYPFAFYPCATVSDCLCFNAPITNTWLKGVPLDNLIQEISASADLLHIRKRSRSDTGKEHFADFR